MVAQAVEESKPSACLEVHLAELILTGILLLLKDDSIKVLKCSFVFEAIHQIFIAHLEEVILYWFLSLLMLYLMTYQWG